MITRRHFLKTSIAGGAAALAGNHLQAAGKQTATGSLIEDVIPPRKGKSVMGLRCKPVEKVRIGIIGIGARGHGTVGRLGTAEGVEVVAVCDIRPEAVDAAQKSLKDNGRREAVACTGDESWRKLCERDDIDLVYNTTPWEEHAAIALYAMDCGKHVVIEVPMALTVSDCWALVDKAEEKQLHCMMLENCCYGDFELATLNMARQGVLGEIVHCEGAYNHDLRHYKFHGYYKHWRLEYSKYHTGNPYPTHGLGPVAQILGINRGDRMAFLSSASTNQFSLAEYAGNTLKDDERITQSQRYKLGDVNTTVVTTEMGKTVMVQHDTSTPHPYTRIHRIQGTKGVAMGYPLERTWIAIDPVRPETEFMKDEDSKALLEKYRHPLCDAYHKSTGLSEETVRKAHGGMDYIMDWRLIYCLRNGYPLDMSVYDGAAWSSLVELTERSVLNRSASVAIPDFTRGEWKNQKPLPVIDMKEVLYG
jgi:predicted dehydrogenase